MNDQCLIMKVYVGHSRQFDFKKELYEPLKQLNHEFIFPHELSNESFNSKEALKTVDLMIAEVSHPSTGLGIEIGWANAYGKRIILLYKKGSKVPSSLKNISSEFIEYQDGKDLIKKLKEL